MALYLYANAVLYFVFAIWSTLSPWKVSANIGYTALSAAGRSEFLVVYGGLELGLAALFAYLAAHPQLPPPIRSCSARECSSHSSSTCPSWRIGW